MPPGAILPATICPQPVDLLVGTPDFQAVDRFIARNVLAAERRIEVDLTAEEAQTALGSDLFLHQCIRPYRTEAAITPHLLYIIVGQTIIAS